VGLSLSFRTSRGELRALDDVNLVVPRGGAIGLVGESGSGKSSLVLAVLGLSGAKVAARRATFDGIDLLTQAAALRGRRIGTVFQDPSTALNPALTIGLQVSEPLMQHLGLSRTAAWRRAEELLAEVGLPRPRDLLAAYPHQLSGGMKQRAVIAGALAAEPEMLLLDEPTTALDVTVEAQIFDLIEALRAKRGLSLLLVSHNLGLVDRVCDRVTVLYAGRVVEEGATQAVLARPLHPYTRGLLGALPTLPALLHPLPQETSAKVGTKWNRAESRREHNGIGSRIRFALCPILQRSRQGEGWGEGDVPPVHAPARRTLTPIPGVLPDLTRPDPGCNFRPRCPFAVTACDAPQTLRAEADAQVRCHREDAATLPWPEDAPTTHRAPAAESAPLIAAEHLVKRFTIGKSWPWRPASKLTAVDGVTLGIRRGETLGLVGESGCGKSTLGRLLLRLIATDSGTLAFDGTPVPTTPGAEFRRRAQIVFQNPDGSLNPRMRVGAMLRRPIERFDLAHGAEAEREVDRLLDLVRLSAAYKDRFAHQLSGGEKQRVGIARALASRPDLIVCDEAVSALDVSVQAAVLNLLAELRDRLGLAMLFISHDIGVIAHIADRIAVMYRGAIVEEGLATQVLAPPWHPYAEALLSAVPIVGARGTSRIRLMGDASSVPPATGCRFAPRCPRRIGPVCDTVAPPVQELAPGHMIACHLMAHPSQAT
jgi:peptide/nickel transport system ATP-binding protein